MATIDDILNNPPQEEQDADKGTAEWSDQQQLPATNVEQDVYKGTAAWAEQNSGENAPVTSPTPATPATTGKDNKVGLDKMNQLLGGGGGSLNQPPSQEELERERKRARRSAIFSAIGDGVSALANLYFTSKGAISTYDPKSSMTAQVNDRWGEYLKDYEARKQAYIKNALAEQKAAADAAAKQAELQRKKEQAAQKERWWQQQFKYKQDQDKADREYKKQQDDRDFQERQRQFNENQQRLKAATTSANTTRKEIAQATAARGRRGKRLGFSDGKGNEVGIYENVWKGSALRAFDLIVPEYNELHKKQPELYPRVRRTMTPKEKEAFVKENWSKTATGRAIMMALSELDPATMTSEAQEDEIIEWTPDNDKGIEEWTPDKK